MILEKLTPLKVLKKLKTRINKGLIGEKCEKCEVYDCSRDVKREFHILYTKMITGVPGMILKIHCYLNKSEDYVVSIDLFTGTEKTHTVRSETGKKYTKETDYKVLQDDIEDRLQDVIMKYENRSFTANSL